MAGQEWLNIAAYSGMFGYGVAMALLGAILPILSARLRLDLADAGNLFLAMNGAMLAATLALGPLLDRFGARPALVVAPLLVAASLALIALAPGGYTGLAVAAMLLGAGGGALNQSANTLVAGLHRDLSRKSAALNLLGVFYGVGALFIPLSIGALLDVLGLGRILGCAIVLILVPAVLGAALRFPPPAGPEDAPSARMSFLATQPLVIILALLLLFQSGNEFILGGFITTRLTRELHASIEQSSYLLAGYWGAIMIMRVILSRILLKVSGHALVTASGLGVAAFAAALILAPSLAVAGAAVIGVGASISAVFPTTLALAGSRYPRNSGTVFGILIAISLVGGMTMPWIAGRLSAAHGAGAGLALVVVGALAISGLQLAVRRQMRGRTLDN
ncbi:MAG: MFS transporter [Acidobacteria bacterium]|nr:MFS transporter [Acidobacteriota bacterium]